MKFHLHTTYQKVFTIKSLEKVSTKSLSDQIHLAKLETNM